MALTLTELRAVLDSSYSEAQESKDSAFLKVLLPIESQFNIIEGCKTLDEQCSACQQLSSTIMVVQMLHPDAEIQHKLNDIRVEIAQFGYLGRK